MAAGTSREGGRSKAPMLKCQVMVLQAVKRWLRAGGWCLVSPTMVTAGVRVLYVVIEEGLHIRCRQRSSQVFHIFVLSLRVIPSCYPFVLSWHVRLTRHSFLFPVVLGGAEALRLFRPVDESSPSIATFDHSLSLSAVHPCTFYISLENAPVS